VRFGLDGHNHMNGLFIEAAADSHNHQSFNHHALQVQDEQSH